MKRSLKRFAFRVSKIYVFILGWIVFGVACAASWQVKVASSDGGSVGTGVLCEYRVFLPAFFYLFYITQRAISITRLMGPPLHLFIPRDIEGEPS